MIALRCGCAALCLIWAMGGAAIAQSRGEGWRGAIADGQRAAAERRLASESDEVLSGVALGHAISGNTLIGDGWRAYYHESGRKVVHTKRGEKIEGRWWIDDSGRFCQTLARRSSASCGARLFRKGEVYNTVSGAGQISGFRIETGNSRRM